MTRKRGTMVTALPPIDGEAYRYAVATGTDGRTYAICSEGVGWEVTPDRPLIVDVWQKTDGGMCQAERTVSLPELLTMAEHGKPVDIADFVRTFGSRLDANVYLWQSRLGA